DDACGTCNGDCTESGGGCVNDDSTADNYGDTCSSWYDANGGCGNWDDDDFNAAEQCCACGGGDITSGTISCGDGSCDCDGNVDAGCGCGEAGPSGCDNACGSTLENDACGVCGGDGSDDLGCGCFEAGPSGCDNACGSTAELDECGVCDGGGIAEGACDCDGNVDAGCGCGEAGPSGCDNACGSTAELDDCGVCAGGNAAMDDCGICDGGNASYDCNNDCSGSLSAGTWVNTNPAGQVDPSAPTTVFGSADDGSWNLSPCVWLDSPSTIDNGDGTVTITSVYGSDADHACELSSGVFNGEVTTTNVSTHDVAAGYAIVGDVEFTLSSANSSNFSVTSTGTFDSIGDDYSLNGSLSGGSSGGAVVDMCNTCDDDASNDCVQDC
ncbi:uncharacterized protein METZ01_LOCUS302135, partial [marine metagenome]